MSAMGRTSSVGTARGDAAGLANEWVMGLIGPEGQRRVRDAFLRPGPWHRLPGPGDWDAAAAIAREALAVHGRAVPEWLGSPSVSRVWERCCEGPVVDLDFLAACCSESREVRRAMLAILVVGLALDGRGA